MQPSWSMSPNHLCTQPPCPAPHQATPLCRTRHPPPTLSPVSFPLPWQRSPTPARPSVLAAKARVSAPLHCGRPTHVGVCRSVLLFPGPGLLHGWSFLHKDPGSCSCALHAQPHRGPFLKLFLSLGHWVVTQAWEPGSPFPSPFSPHTLGHTDLSGRAGGPEASGWQVVPRWLWGTLL